MAIKPSCRKLPEFLWLPAVSQLVVFKAASINKLEENCWGAESVLPRDQDNGLEDKVLADPTETGKTNYTYWDGSIIYCGKCGKFHMFASRWDEAEGFEKVDGKGGWSDSVAIEVKSDSLYGPYDQDERVLWPDDQGGKGHNVFAFRLKEGDPAGKYGIIVRPDGKYEAMNRDGAIAVCLGSITDVFTLQNENLWKDVEGLPTVNMEDPTMWYSGCLYHCVVNQWSARKAYYLVSENGIDGWKLMDGIAYSPEETFLTYEGTDVANHWDKIERPGVYIEDGIVKAMTFAVLDLEKSQDVGNDGHASKVIVVPFDGAVLNEFADKSLCEGGRRSIYL